MAKYIALTFDDGPNTVTTPMVLDVLEKHSAVGTFFLEGNNINEESAKVVKRAVEMGCEIENHSRTHTAFPQLTAEEMTAEIDFTTEKIIGITGRAPKFFRPPYIALNVQHHTSHIHMRKGLHRLGGQRFGRAAF